VLGLVAFCIAAAPAPAWSARWFASLPADDPDTVRPMHGVAPSRQAPLTPMPGAPASVVETLSGGSGSSNTPGAPNAAPEPPGGVLAGVLGFATGYLWSAMGAVHGVAVTTREALWETSYMFGINRVPVPRSAVSDPVADLAPTPDEPIASEATAKPEPADPPEHAGTLRQAGPLEHSASAAQDAGARDAQGPGASNAPEPNPTGSGMSAATAAQPQAIDPGLLANFIYDRGARRANGSYFVPKPLQRLFNVRTQRVTAAEVPVALSLAGRIIADPRNRGDVEASLLGRIEPAEGGIPVLGQTVAKGDILAYVAPAVGVVDRTQVRRDVARLTTEIRVETESLETLRQFSFVPFRDGKIYQSEQRVAGLRREREVLLPLLRSQEVLRASADGVISTSTAIAGRIVHPGEPVFSIVDPNRLWVEASAPDTSVAASAASVRHANATTPEGQSLTLSFVGSGLALREQSVPVLFRIENPPVGLRVGRPVTVAIQSERHFQRGMPLTRDALTIGADGVQEVWEQSEPEVFLPHAVRVVDLDGRTVLVVDGLKEGAHVVTVGVHLLAQLQ